MISNNKRSLIVAFLVSIITISVFLPALQNGFVNWDDNLHVYNNPDIRSLDLDFLRWMFSFQETIWVPLTRLSHALNYAVWGLDPMGHHLTNILFHGFNAFLVVLLATRLIAGSSSEDGTAFAEHALIAGGVTGILFGIHPLRVESVVWITERKDVLSGFFVLLSLLYYLKFTAVSIKSRIKTYYLFSLVFFCMALMCKPMVVTLPAVLVILDIYPLRRFKSSQLKVIAEKIPFFALSLLLSVVTVSFYKYIGIMVMESDVAFMDRLLVAVQSLSFYLYKMVWPLDLAPIYPYPKEISITAPEFALPLVIVTGITAFCIYSWKRQRVWMAAWAYFIVTLLPVLGIIKFGAFAAADRYTYLPGLGPMLLAGLGVSWLWRRAAFAKNMVTLKKTAVIVSSVLVISMLSIMTVRQIPVWNNSISLWSSELALYSLDQAFNSRGNAYRGQGQIELAMRDFTNAIEVNPEYALAYNNRGNAYFLLEKYQKAQVDFSSAIELDPEYVSPYYNRALSYRRMGDIDNANRDLQSAARLGDKMAREYLESIGMDY